jgi:hypothetical protein
VHRQPDSRPGCAEERRGFPALEPEDIVPVKDSRDHAVGREPGGRTDELGDGAKLDGIDGSDASGNDAWPAPLTSSSAMPQIGQSLATADETSRCMGQT